MCNGWRPPSVSQSVSRSVSYLVGDFDEESKDDNDEQVVDDADGSNDDVAELERDIADVSQVQVQLSVVCRVVTFIRRTRHAADVLHRSFRITHARL